MNPFKNGNLGYGIAFGLGAALLAPLAARMLSGAGKPLLKESIKGGLYLYDQGKLLLAEAKETFEDISAEARSEMGETKQAAGGKN